MASRPQIFRMRSLLLLAVTISAVVMGCSAVKPLDPPATIESAAGGIANLTTFVAAVKASPEIHKAAKDKKTEVTVFAPTNEAFAAALASLGLTAEELLSKKTLVTTILSYHIVPQVIHAADIPASEQVPTLLTGKNLQLSQVNGTVTVNNATVVDADIPAGKSVIHIINKVLLPPT